MAKRLGIIPYRFAKPIFVGLREQGDAVHSFELTEDSPARLALKLREKQLDAAFLSPIDYAKDYAMYSIIPRVGIASRGNSATAAVLFKENLRTVKSIAVNPVSSSEIVLAHIVFAEKYGSPPSMIPFSASVQQVLGKYDAILCSGDEADAFRDYPYKLDLVEEWEDISELPFVHGIWVTREHALVDEELRTIMNSSGKQQSPYRVDSLNQFQYDMNAEAQAGLAEFFRMAYYHGILPDVPDVRFLSLADDRLRMPEQMN